MCRRMMPFNAFYSGLCYTFKSLTLRKLKGRMTKVIRFLYVYRSLESLLSERPIYIQIRALALAFQLARAPPARCKGCRSVATKSLRVKDLPLGFSFTKSDSFVFTVKGFWQHCLWNWICKTNCGSYGSTSLGLRVFKKEKAFSRDLNALTLFQFQPYG